MKYLIGMIILANFNFSSTVLADSGDLARAQKLTIKLLLKALYPNIAKTDLEKKMIWRLRERLETSAGRTDEIRFPKNAYQLDSLEERMRKIAQEVVENVALLQKARAEGQTQSEERTRVSIVVQIIKAYSLAGANQKTDSALLGMQLLASAALTLSPLTLPGFANSPALDHFMDSHLYIAAASEFALMMGPLIGIFSLIYDVFIQQRDPVYSPTLIPQAVVQQLKVRTAPKILGIFWNSVAESLKEMDLASSRASQTDVPLALLTPVRGTRGSTSRYARTFLDWVDGNAESTVTFAPCEAVLAGSF